MTSLREFLHGDRLAQLAELDALLREPEFAAATSPATNTERNLRTYARLAAVGRHEGGSLALAGDVRRLFCVQEWMAVVDPCVFHAALVHFAVCTWTIRELGRPGADLAELTAELDRQARRRHDPHHRGRPQQQPHRRRHRGALRRRRRAVRRCSTPDDGAVKVMANVAEPGVPKSAIVFAELVVDERRCGVFPFAMRIRTADGPASGVRIAALSDVAAVPLDYALVRFDDARVPFDSWLRDSASLATDGTFEDPLDRPGERLVRSLAFSAHAGLGASVGLAAAARASVTVALRHSRQRVTSGTLAPGLEVLGYSTQQWALYTALADALATTFLVDQAKTMVGGRRARAGVARPGRRSRPGPP